MTENILDRLKYLRDFMIRNSSARRGKLGGNDLTYLDDICPDSSEREAVEVVLSRRDVKLLISSLDQRITSMENEEGAKMKEKPQFDYEQFEDYLFMAIQRARSLHVLDICDDEDVLRYLKLAERQVRWFMKDMNSRDMENEK
jgi:hypothetical protein